MPSISATVSTLINGLQSAPVTKFWDNPCRANDSEDPVEPRGIKDMINNITKEINGARFLSQQLKEYNKEVFHYNGTVLDALDKAHFFDDNRYNLSERALSEAITYPVAALQFHYSLVYELVVHVHTSLTDGEISTKIRDEYPTRNKTLKDKLLDIQENMQDIMCSIKIALRGEGADSEHNGPQDVLSADFLGLNINLLCETYRAYILMNDCENIMDYLKSVYKRIMNTQTS